MSRELEERLRGPMFEDAGQLEDAATEAADQLKRYREALEKIATETSCLQSNPASCCPMVARQALSGDTQ